MNGCREVPSEGAFSESVLIVVSYAIILSLLVKPLKHFTEDPKESDGEAFNCMYVLLSINQRPAWKCSCWLSCSPVLAVSVPACALCRGEPRTTMAVDLPLF